MKNPLTNGQIVATNYDSRNYCLQSYRRGDACYVMSRSDLMEFAICPLRWRRGAKADDSIDSTEWGSLVDCIVLDEDRFDSRFAIKPETYPSEKGGEKPWSGNSTWCKEWIREQGDKICITNETWRDAFSAADRLKKDLIIGPLLETSDFQVYVTAEYHDEKTGIVVPVKALIDIVPRKSLACSLIDSKTARDANPAQWGRVVNARGYHVQAALHLDCYNSATGEDRDEFRHIVQENFAPYEVSKPNLDSSFINLGRARYIDALKLYAKCLKSNSWDSYDDLQRENYDGWPVVSPEAYMVTASDPDWLSDKEAA
jgi:hypothetical protein